MNKNEFVHPFSYHVPIIANTCNSWKELLFMATPLTLEKNAHVQGFVNDRHDFFFVQKGMLQVKDYFHSGKVSHGICFAEGSLCNVASASLQLDYTELGLYCIKKSLIYRFNGNLLQDFDFMAKYPLQVTEAHKQLAKNILIYSVYNSFMTDSTPKEKIARFLLAYAHEQNSTTFALPLNQEEVAHILKMHRVTFLKCLQAFKEDGLIQLEKRNITLLDIDSLDLISQG